MNNGQLKLMVAHQRHLSNLLSRPVSEAELMRDWIDHYAVWYRATICHGQF